MPNLPVTRPPRFLELTQPGAQATNVHFKRVASSWPPPRSQAEREAEQLAAVTPPPATPLPNPPVAAALASPPPPQPTPTSLPAEPLAPPVDRSVAGLDHAIARLRLEASRLAEQARTDALEIGFQIARRIIEVELTARPEPLFALVRSAIRRLGNARRLTIHLHPDDAGLVDTPDARGKLGLTVLTVDVVADPSLARGDCLVTSETASVDGRLATRLEELQRSVEASVHEETT